MEFVHKRIVAERDNGAAVIVVSTELDEVLGLADRIGVMYRGKIIGEMPAGADPAEIGLLMAGNVRPGSRPGQGGVGSVSEQTVDPAADPQPAADAARRTRRPSPPASGAGCAASSLIVTVLAFVTAMVLGGILIAVADPRRRTPRTTSSSTPGTPSSYGFQAVWTGYVALFQGAIFNPHTASKGTLAGYVGPISETLTNATPLILGGLSVGLAFRAGLFNIGGQGQVIMGAICAGFVGFHWHLAPGLHLVLGDPRRHARRRALGRSRRAPQGQDRRPRGDHDDHAQLHRGLLPGLPAVGQGVPGARRTARRSPTACSRAPSCRRCSAAASASTAA